MDRFSEVSQIFPHFALKSREREVKSPCFYYVWWALNAPNNTNSNVNSVDDNNSNDIPVPIWIVNTNALYAILYFKQMNKTNTHVNVVQDQTTFKENGLQVVTVYQNRQKGWYPETIRFDYQLILGIMSPYQYLASTEDVAIPGIFYAS